jgi:formylglycine-generating enzyme required for sulfatase activity
MLLKKIFISAVILLTACNSAEEQSAIKGPSADMFPSLAVAPELLSASHQKRLALVIGNSAYAGKRFLTNSVNDAKAFFSDRLANGSQGPEMVWIKGGSFRMGDSQDVGYSNEKPVQRVSVARFAMGRYEVRVSEFRLFVNATQYKTDAEKGDGCWTSAGGWKKMMDANWRNPKFSKTENHPVVCVSWNDISAYAAWLSQQTGHTYRLPTEAQWEYAARAGTTTSRYWGNNPNEACRYANVADKTAKNKYSNWTIHNCTDGYVYTAPAGSFKPNAFGLFDMLGNVWEWTCSKYENKYKGEENKCTVPKSGTLWALRGGAWGNIPRSVRAAFRGGAAHEDRDADIGFRLVRF